MEVTLLTQADCTWCEHAERILQRLAEEFPLTVTTMDLHTPAGQALAEHGGILFPPGLFMTARPSPTGGSRSAGSDVNSSAVCRPPSRGQDHDEGTVTPEALLVGVVVAAGGLDGGRRGRGPGAVWLPGNALGIRIPLEPHQVPSQIAGVLLVLLGLVWVLSEER